MKSRGELEEITLQQARERYEPLIVSLVERAFTEKQDCKHYERGLGGNSRRLTAHYNGNFDKVLMVQSSPHTSRAVIVTRGAKL